MAEIRYEGVTKRFGRRVVIGGLDLTIGDGEFFTFLGPSGCGKSTILNMTAGLEEVSAGRIYFDSRDVTGLNPSERDVAMVFQNYALYPHMTVFENIAFPLRMKKTPRAEVEREVRRVAGVLGLKEMLEKRPAQLSGGERQRVALGRAMVRRPVVFLMDEPLSNLDARLRIEMRAEIKRLHRELGVTTIYVTHDQSEAMGLSDRMAVLHEGRIRQCAPPLEVYRRPADTFVAGFIGSPPMNLFDATVGGTPPSLLVEGVPLTALPGARSGPVIAGIRPTDLVARAGGLAVVEITETEGETTWVVFSWQGLSLRGRFEGERVPAPGEKVSFHVEARAVHLFDPASGTRLPSGVHEEDEPA